MKNIILSLMVAMFLVGCGGQARAEWEGVHFLQPEVVAMPAPQFVQKFWPETGTGKVNVFRLYNCNKVGKHIEWTPADTNLYQLNPFTGKMKIIDRIQSNGTTCIIDLQ